jgi:hypothetical protein
VSSFSTAKSVAVLVLLFVSGVFSASAFASCDQHDPRYLNAMAQQYQAEIVSASYYNRVNPNLIKAVITAESCFRPGAVSGKGAGGLMQLMPATARRFGVGNRFDSAENIQGGARYLRWLLNRYGGSIPHAVAAYNAGEGRVDVYGAAVPITETQVYTQRVLNAYKKLSGGGRASNGGRTGGRCEVVTNSLYTIHGNETLFHVARRYGMDVKRLAALNGIARPYRVEQGQRLRVEDCGRWASAGSSTTSSNNRAQLASKIHESFGKRPAAAKKAEKNELWGFSF